MSVLESEQDDFLPPHMLTIVLQDLDLFLDANVDIAALVDLLGKDKVAAIITDRVRSCMRSF
jgi:hypothetical protein